jgi:hypothetical protein
MITSVSFSGFHVMLFASFALVLIVFELLDWSQIYGTKSLSDPQSRNVWNLSYRASCESHIESASQHNVGVWLYANLQNHNYGNKEGSHDRGSHKDVQTSNDTVSNSQITYSVVDRLRNQGIDTIYLAGTTIHGWKDPYLRHNYIDFIRHSKCNGISVFAVVLEDPWFASQSASELRNYFADFINVTKGIFDTYVVDVEPYTIPNADPNIFIPNYIRMSSILREVADKYSVKLIETVPSWYHSAIKELGIPSGINVLSGKELNIMDYAFTAKQAFTNLRQILDEVSRPISVSVKISPGLGAPHMSGEEVIKAGDFLKSNNVPVILFEAAYLIHVMNGSRL